MMSIPRAGIVLILSLFASRAEALRRTHLGSSPELDVRATGITFRDKEAATTSGVRHAIRPESWPDSALVVARYSRRGAQEHSFRGVGRPNGDIARCRCAGRHRATLFDI